MDAPAGTRRGIVEALVAAVLFGASTPVAKLLLGSIGPILLAGLLYLGAGVGLSLVLFIRPRHTREARLRREDVPLLAGIIVCGGVAAPILMLFGLRHVSGLAGSLLLNLEAPFTMLLAVVAFREHVGAREILGATAIIAAAVALGAAPGPVEGDVTGVLALSGACICWAVDNNLTGRLSLRDPAALTRVKTLAAGAVVAAVGLGSAQTLPALNVMAAALVLGSLGYGASLVLAVRAMRSLGTARQAAYFATAPFAGAALSIPLLGERPGVPEAVAAITMLVGLASIMRARHFHVHTHESLVHDHVHVHDEHHRHGHDGPISEPHSHIHRHDPISHGHPHVSDVHHRHQH